MQRKLGGDPAPPIPLAFLRLPGFVNRSIKPSFRVQAEKHTDHIHHYKIFAYRTEPIDNDFRAHYRLLTQRLLKRTPDQSEHGLDLCEARPRPRRRPEEIIRRIADFAAVKSDPATRYQQSTPAISTEEALRPSRWMASQIKSSAFNSFVLAEHP